MDFKKLFKNNNDNFNVLGDYSSRTGFENEDALGKNPYQSIYANRQNNNNNDISYNANDLINNKLFSGDIEFGLKTKSNYDDIANNQDFWNRKDIYDIKQRLQASGVDVPEQTKVKEKPNFLIRTLNKLGMLGYGVTTGLYNALDDDKETKFLQGVGQGLKAGWSNTGEEKTASDILKMLENSKSEGKQLLSKILNPVGAIGDTMQTSDNKVISTIGKGVEGVGNFTSGLLGDILLDPANYVTLGSGTIAKTLAKEGTEALSKETVEKLAKESAEKVAKNLDYIPEIGRNVDGVAKASADKINKIIGNELKDGIAIVNPFTQSPIFEFKSADEVAKIVDDLGLKGSLKPIVDKAKGVIDAKAETSNLVKGLTEIPDNLRSLFDSDYKQFGKLAKNGETEEAITQLVNKKFTDLITHSSKKNTDTTIREALGLIKDLQDNKVDLSDGEFIDLLENFKSGYKEVVGEELNLDNLDNVAKELQDVLSKKDLNIQKNFQEQLSLIMGEAWKQSKDNLPLLDSLRRMYGKDNTDVILKQLGSFDKANEKELNKLLYRLDKQSEFMENKTAFRTGDVDAIDNARDFLKEKSELLSYFKTMGIKYSEDSLELANNYDEAFRSLTNAELKNYLKHNNIKGYSKLRKDELVDMAIDLKVEGGSKLRMFNSLNDRYKSMSYAERQVVDRFNFKQLDDYINKSKSYSITKEIKRNIANLENPNAYLDVMKNTQPELYDKVKKMFYKQNIFEGDMLKNYNNAESVIARLQKDREITKELTNKLELMSKSPEELKKFFDEFGVNTDSLNVILEEREKLVEARKSLDKFTGQRSFEDMLEVMKSIYGESTDFDIEKYNNIKQNVFKEMTNSLEDIYGHRIKEFIDESYNKHVKNELTSFVKYNTEEFWEQKENIDSLNAFIQAKGLKDIDVNKFKESINKYNEFMTRLGKEEGEWGILKEQINKGLYVPHRMSKEFLDQNSADMQYVLDLWEEKQLNMAGRKNYYAENRKLGTLKEKNENMMKALREADPDIRIEGSVYEKDLSKLLIQRAFEHGDSLYDKGMKDVYLNGMGQKLDWYTSKNGGIFNIVENANRTIDHKKGQEYTLDVLKSMINSGNLEKLKEVYFEVSSFIPEGKHVDMDLRNKVVDTWTKKYDLYKSKTEEALTLMREGKFKEMKDVKKEVDNLKMQLITDLPQRSYARGMMEKVKKGDYKIVYPDGQYKTVNLGTISEEARKNLSREALESHTTGLKELSFSDLEQLNLQDRRVDAFLIDKNSYEAYQKATNLQVEKDKNAFLKIYDTYTGIFKAMATLSPNFHVGNTFGNDFQSFLDIGAKTFSPKYKSLANKVYSAKNLDEVIELGGKKYTLGELKTLAEETGALSTSMIESEFRGFKNGKQTLDEALKNTQKDTYKDIWNNSKNKLNPLKANGDDSWVMYQLSTKLGEAVEGQGRLKHFLIKLDEGLTPQQASDSVNRFLFNYDELTDFEQSFMKRAIPFYTFAKKNLGLQFEQLMEQPQTFSNAKKVFDNWNASVLNEDEQDLIDNDDKFKFMGKVFGKTKIFDPKVPWLQDPGSLLGSLNPLIKTPLELATNKNFSFDNQIESYEGQTKQVDGVEGLLLSILQQTEKGADGNTYASKKSSHALTNLLPLVRTSDRLIDEGAMTLENPIEGILSSLGIGRQEFNVDRAITTEVQQYKDLLEALEKKINSQGTNTREAYQKQKDKSNNDDYLKDILKGLGIK